MALFVFIKNNLLICWCLAAQILWQLDAAGLLFAFAFVAAQYTGGVHAVCWVPAAGCAPAVLAACMCSLTVVPLLLCAPQQNNVYIFVAVVPVLLDALFKLWLFQGFVRTNPAGAVTLKAMDRH